MKLPIIIILTILFLFSCDGKKEKVSSTYENGQPEWVVKYNSSSDTTNMTIIGYYEDGTKKCVKNIKDGIEDGNQLLFYSNGQIETICNKKNGILHGKSKTYFENGNLNAHGNFENGQRQGKWELWNTSGTKFIRNYLNDTLHGSTMEIRTDSSVVYGQYERGTETGEWITKSPDSVITMISTYKRGVRNGVVKTFYQTGEIYVNGYFDNGKKQGEWEIYNKSGIIDTIEVYRNDTLIGYKLIK